MKINEMQLDEFIPITKKGRAIRRAEKAGAADVKQTVDDMETEFASLLGTQNKRFKSATTDDVVAFLKSKKVDTSRIDTTQPMNPKRINQVFTTLVRDKITGANLADPKADQPTDNAAQSNTQTQAVDVKSIQDAVSQLPQNQIASLRAIAAKRAGAKQ